MTVKKRRVQLVRVLILVDSLAQYRALVGYLGLHRPANKGIYVKLLIINVNGCYLTL